MKKQVKYLLIITVILIIVAIIGKRKGWFGKEIIVKVSTEKVVRRNITETITANGTIQPETEVKISPDVSGEIVQINIKEGQQVKKGDLLLKIKPDIYISSLERAKAALNSARAQLAQAQAQFIDKESTYNRNKKLWKKEAISQSEFEAAESAYKVSKANVDAASFAIKSSEASVKEANENLFKTTIYSPMSGTISKLNVEEGERVVGTIQMAGTEMLRVADLSKMEVVVDVNENDIIRVHMGDTAIVEVDAYLDHNFKGVVTEIANSANTSNLGAATDQVTSFNVKIRLLQESYADLIPKDNINYSPFRPGMSASVDIQTKKVYNVLTIPISAVTVKNDSTNIDNPNQDNEVVFLFNNDVAKIQKVKTGIQNNEYIEIISGLDTSNEVITAPYDAISKFLEDGTKVKKVDKEKLFIQE